MYKTVVLGYHSKARKMAASIEECANLMADQGYELITFSLTGSGKAILLFKDSTPYNPKKPKKKNSGKKEPAAVDSVTRIEWEEEFPSEEVSGETGESTEET